MTSVAARFMWYKVTLQIRTNYRRIASSSKLACTSIPTVESI